METAAPKVAVQLNPVPGFCIKSRAVQEARINENPLVRQGTKVFVNVAWDPNVPPPPPAGDDAVRRAMHGLEPGDWFVPVVLSDARQDSDKAGQPAIVFDCVLNPSLKSRSLKDPEFKSFIIELALQRVEAQTALILSRQIGTPNIASKGKPQPRQIFVDTALYPPRDPNYQATPPLVQEISAHSPSVPDKVQPKCILKKPEVPIPAWSWEQQGSRIRIVFDVPGVTRAVIPDCTLDIEPRRIMLHIPVLYGFDLNLDAPDSELSSIFGKTDTADQALKLKRMRNLDVDNAKAEWHVADRAIILFA